MLVPARRYDPEWMDRPGNPRVELEPALRDLGRVNRAFGGRRALLRAAEPFLEGLGPGETLRVLDVGAGGADLPVALVERARRQGLAIEVVALDRDPATAAIARADTAAHPEIRIVQADALEAPFGAGAFDLVTASLFLHHFDEHRATELLRAFRRLARRAVLVNDLRRHYVPWAFFHVAARVAGYHPMIVHDGPLSILRGFTAAELRTLAQQAGAPGARLEHRWPYRLVLTIPGEGTAT